VGGKRLEVEFVSGDLRGRQTTAEARIRVPGDEPVQALLRLWSATASSDAEAVERYYGEARYVDGFVTELIAQLKQAGLYDSSLIVFTSDHGEGLGEHDWMTHAEYVYDEQIHVPLIVKLPAGHTAEEALRARARSMVRHVDVAPTVLEVLGLRPLPGQLGRSLLHEGERVLVAETHPPIAERHRICLRDDAYKLIYDMDAETFEMYDLSADPGERNDIFAQARRERPDWVEKLQRIGLMSLQVDRQLVGENDEELRAQLEALGY